MKPNERQQPPMKHTPAPQPPKCPQCRQPHTPDTPGTTLPWEDAPRCNDPSRDRRCTGTRTVGDAIYASVGASEYGSVWFRADQVLAVSTDTSPDGRQVRVDLVGGRTVHGTSVPFGPDDLASLFVAWLADRCALLRVPGAR